MLAHLIPVKFNTDERGSLVAFDRDTLPFAPARTFFISSVPAGRLRAGHAVSCDEFLWPLSGCCSVSLDDGKIQASFRLEARRDGLFVPAGIWIRLEEFNPDTILAVFASKAYSDTVYFERPRSELFAERHGTDDSASGP